MNACAARSLLSVCRTLWRAQPNMPAALSQHSLRPGRLPFRLAALRRSSAGCHLGNALGGRQQGLPTAAPQRQRERRLAAAAASSTAEAEPQAAAPSPSPLRKELPKSFDPAASEEALYQW